ncbi:Ankyrin_repeat-containing protein [Hexamita inflata]|uniref:Ankyrin repeat-containing protein n=1 Tax=Hexamita inflata TaxID=28002 RepID=A0AA86TCS0_9EUKA|nr:Ankyrin repeat-containing protein [Hexamita inflata]
MSIFDFVKQKNYAQIRQSLRFANQLDSEGFSPLMRAIQLKDAESVKLLLPRGRDILNEWHLTPLMVAAESNCLEFVQALIPGFKEQVLSKRYKNYPKGSTALQIAVQCGNVQFATELCSFESELSLCSQLHLQTILFDLKSTPQKLFKQSTLDSLKRSPLHYAIFSYNQNQLNFKETIMQLHCFSGMTDVHGLTALMYAVLSQQINLVQLITQTLPNELKVQTTRAQFGLGIGASALMLALKKFPEAAQYLMSEVGIVTADGGRAIDLAPADQKHLFQLERNAEAMPPSPPRKTPISPTKISTPLNKQSPTQNKSSPSTPQKPFQIKMLENESIINMRTNDEILLFIYDQLSVKDPVKAVQVLCEHDENLTNGISDKTRELALLKEEIKNLQTQSQTNLKQKTQEINKILKQQIEQFKNVQREDKESQTELKISENGMQTIKPSDQSSQTTYQTLHKRVQTIVQLCSETGNFVQLYETLKQLKTIKEDLDQSLTEYKLNRIKFLQGPIQTLKQKLKPFDIQMDFKAEILEDSMTSYTNNGVRRKKDKKILVDVEEISRILMERSQLMSILAQEKEQGQQLAIELDEKMQEM